MYLVSSADLCGLYCAVNVSATGPLEPCAAASLLRLCVPLAVATTCAGVPVEVPVLDVAVPVPVVVDVLEVVCPAPATSPCKSPSSVCRVLISPAALVPAAVAVVVAADTVDTPAAAAW